MPANRIYIGLLLLCCSLLWLSGCRSNGAWQDDRIDAAVREEIAGLNRQVAQGFADNNPDKVLAVCSDKLIAVGKSDLYNLIQRVSGVMDPARLSTQHQFHIRGKEENVQMNASSGTGPHDYKLSFLSVCKESVAAVSLFKDSFQTVAMLTVYGKYEEGWKLNILRVGILEMLGRDAPGWYEQAQGLFNNGSLADAANAMALSAELAHPFGEYFKYGREKEISAFNERLKTAIGKAYSFPVQVSQVPGRPAIFRILPQVLREGAYPLIMYTTSVPLSDTSAVSAECSELHRHIGQVFRGMDRNNAVILYRAFDHIPTDNEEVRWFGMVRHREQTQP